MIKVTPDGRMNVANAAKYIGVSESLLNTLRSKTKKTGKLQGPAFTKLSGRIFYFKDAIDAWIRSREVI